MASRGQPNDYPKLPITNSLELELEGSEIDNQWITQEILPGVFLGPFTAASRRNLEKMKEAGLTHVVCIRTEDERNFLLINHPMEFQYQVVTLHNLQSIIEKVREVSQFIETCLAAGGKVLIYGNTGLELATAFAIGYIMFKYGTTYDTAFSYLSHIRQGVGNQYEDHLKALENSLSSELGQETLQQTLEEPGSADKRKFEGDDEAENKKTKLDKANLRRF